MTTKRTQQRRTPEEVVKIYEQIFRKKEKLGSAFSTKKALVEHGLNEGRYGNWAYRKRHNIPKGAAIVLPNATPEIAPGKTTTKRKLAIVMGTPDEIAAFAREFLQ